MGAKGWFPQELQESRRMCGMANEDASAEMAAISTGNEAGRLESPCGGSRGLVLSTQRTIR